MPSALTARTVETIKPLAHRQEIADAYMPGLYLIVQPSGARSWAIRYRLGGRSRKHTLGPYPVFDLATARHPRPRRCGQWRKAGTLPWRRWRRATSARTPSRPWLGSSSNCTAGASTSPGQSREPSNYSTCMFCRVGGTG